MKRWVTSITLLSCFLCLASCGGEGAPMAGGGIGGSGSVATVTAGPVTGFGSVFVSGKEFDTTQTAFLIEGQTGAENGLKKGMVVVVEGTVTYNYGTNDPPKRIAKTIAYEDTVEGYVQSVSADGLSLVVLGQVILVNGSTIIDPSLPNGDIRSLHPDIDVVEVSGFVLTDGRIVASSLELKSGAPDYQAKGFIASHDAANKTFQIGSLVVDYATADISQMPDPAGDKWKGLLVDVRGDQYNRGGSGPNGARLAATKVKPDRLGLEDTDEAEIEGFVTQVIAAGDFFIGSVRVQTGPETQFKNGAVEDLVPGVKLEVEGPVRSGALQAEAVEFKDSVKLRSTVATVSPTASHAGTLTLVGLPGLTVQVDSHTKVEGEGDLKGFAELRVGDSVALRGRPWSGSEVLATGLKRTSPTIEAVLQGPVESAANPVLVALGIRVDTAAIPDAKFRAKDGAVIGRAAFFASVTTKTVVELLGTVSGEAIVWKEARLHSDD